MRITGLLGGTAVLGFVFAGGLAAQSAAPKDATGQCTDGSYTTAKTEARGCLKHGGVKTWFAGSTTSSAATAGASVKAVAPASSSEPSQRASRSTSMGGAAPKGATGQCTDGSYTTAKTEARGCLKHGGVKSWFAGAGAAAADVAAAPAPTGAAEAPASPPVAATPASGAGAAAPVRAAPSAQVPALAPTSPSDVWVNLSTKAYHCPGTKYYGTTKRGKYMSEAEAKAAGFHASYGKACS